MAGQNGSSQKENITKAIRNAYFLMPHMSWIFSKFRLKNNAIVHGTPKSL